jgi:hypothetical protein
MALHYSPNIVTNGLVLALDASDPKSYPGSGTTWFDRSGLGNNGTLVNGVGYNSVNRGSLVFDGVNDYVSVSANSTIPYGASPRTIGIWFYTNSTTWVGNANTLFFYGNSATGQAFGIDMDSYPRMEFFTWGGSGRDLTFSTTFSEIGWKNICVTFDGSTSVNIFENGSFTRTLTLISPCNTITSDVLIGRYLGSYYDGNIAVAQIYNRALSASEIAQNFNATRGRFGL